MYIYDHLPEPRKLELINWFLNRYACLNKQGYQFGVHFEESRCHYFEYKYYFMCFKKRCEHAIRPSSLASFNEKVIKQCGDFWKVFYWSKTHLCGYHHYSLNDTMIFPDPDYEERLGYLESDSDTDDVVHEDQEPE